MGFTFTCEKGDASNPASCVAFCICGEYNLSPSRAESLSQSKQSTQMTLVERGLEIINKGGKFLKKLWCCVGGSITR